MDELMQMAVIELVRKEAKTEGGHRVRRLKVTSELQLTAGQVDQVYLGAAQRTVQCGQVRGGHEPDHIDAEPRRCQGWVAQSYGHC